MEAENVKHEAENEQDVDDDEGDEASHASSVGDFSASEDEWTPAKEEQTKVAEKSVPKRKSKAQPAKKPIVPARVSRRIAAKRGIVLPEEPETAELPANAQSIPAPSSSEDESASEEEKKAPKRAKRKPVRRKGKPPARQKSPSADDEPIKLTTFTVEQLYRKYRPDLAHPERPSTSKAPAAPPTKRTKPNSAPGDGTGDESESSGDDYLVDPSELDLNSDFFRPSEQEKEQRHAVNLYFDCNAGVELTDSEEEEDASDRVINVHKVALLCWIGHGTYVNSVLRKPSLMRFALKKLLPGVMGQTSTANRPNGLTNVRYFQELTRYYRRTVTLKDDTMFYRQRQHPALGKFLIFAIAKKATYCRRDYILLFVLMLRIVGVHARLIIAPPVPPKHVPSDQLYKMNPKTPQEMAMERKLLEDFRQAPRDSMVYVAKQKLRALIAKQKDSTGKGVKRRAAGGGGFSIPQLDGGADEPSLLARDKKQKLKLMKGSFLRVENNRKPALPVEGDDEEEQSAVPDEVQQRRQRILAAYRARAARLASKKEKDAKRKGDDGKKKANGKVGCGVDYWVEVFCEHEDKWITIDVLKGSVYNLEDIVKQATQPIAYVLAWNNDGTIKDVSPRYISRLGSKKSKLRVEDAWLEKALRPYRGKRTKRDLIEDVKFDRLLNKRPFPEQIGEYKNHPKYAIERYLLRNEAIYPRDAPILGHIRDEPIYLRDCVHTLHSRESWLRQAKTVRLHEEPYKVVKAKAKYDRFTGAAITGQTVELFGEWQVQDYVPPVAKDGLVPRSAYGNVDLFQPCMLPKGTVHLQLPGLNRICRRMRIDCAQAITGFEYRNGGCQAVYDGFVVCEEFRDRLLDEWYAEQVELQEKEDERRRKRIYGNWRRLIMGLCIRKKLKDRYNFDNM
uniref:Rad4 beta-hairpin domain-containing protein n=1 Tax=Anopheles coluzzii TaxID=1518534 RepID=A0A8W7Q262_ANOCL